VRGGYAQLTEYLAQRVRELGGTIVLGAVVRQIEWQPESVHVVTESGAEFHAKKCVVTLPLGVLQRANRGGVEIIPEPPAVEAARRLAMGQVVRFTMVFRRAWWTDATVALPVETLRSMSFLFTQETVPAVWWTPHPEPGPAMLTAWIGGSRSAKLMGQTAEQLGEAACRTLAQVFGLAEDDVRRELVSTHMHDWAGDPFSLGAYSYLPAGALDAPRAMTAPEFGTLFFAGEHTDITGHWGTVHAAIRSGLRAAEQIFGQSTA
jgi:monoamine oxidase